MSASTPAGRLRRAETLRRSGQLTKAADLLRKTLEDDPRDADVRRKLADVLGESGSRDSAISEYVKVQELLAAKGDLLGAIGAGLKVVELDPKFDNPLAYVAKIKLDSLREEQKAQAAKTVAVGKLTPLSDIPLLSDLRPEELETVAGSMRRLEVKEGESIFEEGHSGESLFFIVSGLMEVTVKNNKLGLVTSGQCFGEFSFLTGQPRTASVRALEDSELLELSASSMREIVKSHRRLQEVLFNMYRDRALVNVLALSPLFEILSSKDRASLAPRFQLVTLSPGEAVVQEGEAGGALYLIKSGKLEVRATTPNGEILTLARLGRHQFFGEVSFLTGVPRTATVHALEETELLMIEEPALQELVQVHPYLKEVLSHYHLSRVMATADTLKTFLKKERVGGILQ